MKDKEVKAREGGLKVVSMPKKKLNEEKKDVNKT